MEYLNTDQIFDEELLIIGVIMGYYGFLKETLCLLEIHNEIFISDMMMGLISK